MLRVNSYKDAGTKFYNIAFDFYSKDFIKEALFYFKKAIEAYSSNANYHFYQAVCYLKLELFEDSINSFKRAIEEDSNNDIFYYNLANVYYHTTDYNSAIAFYKKAIEIDKNKDIYYYNLSITYFVLRDINNSLKFINRAIEIGNDFIDSYIHRANIFIEKKEYSKALEDYQYLINKEKLLSESYFQMGQIYSIMHKWDLAIEAFNLSLQESDTTMDNFITNLTCKYSLKESIDTEECFYPTKSQMENFTFFLERGYMRYANYFRLKVCKDCNICLPMRIDTASFKLTKSQKRILKKNSDVRVIILDRTSIDEEKFNLFKKYHEIRHKDNINNSYESIMASRHFGFKGSIELNFYINEKLIGVSIIDLSKDGFSSNFFYYDTDYMERALGIFSILYEIEYAKKLGIKYYYIGWYTPTISNMKYKDQFRPSEVYVNNKWILFEEYLRKEKKTISTFFQAESNSI